MKKINLTKEQLEEIKRLYLEERKSSYKIAEIFNCSDVFILNCLKCMGIPRRTSGESHKGVKEKPLTEVQRKARIETVKQSYINHPELRENRSLTSLKAREKERESGKDKIIAKKISITRKNLFEEGKLKSWSIGLTKETDGRLMNLSKSKEGCKRPDLTKRNLENNPMKNPETIKKVLQSLFKRPTSFEQKISTLCFKYNLPFVYRGDGGFLINFKNPDFVNEKDKVVIEVFYSWFKIRDYGSVENYKEFCRRKYEPAGWKVIFIDELDLSHENWEEVCLNKILKVKNCLK